MITDIELEDASNSYYTNVFFAHICIQIVSAAKLHHITFKHLVRLTTHFVV